jgi:hypothetical protein
MVRGCRRRKGVRDFDFLINVKIYDKKHNLITDRARDLVLKKLINRKDYVKPGINPNIV